MKYRPAAVIAALFVCMAQQLFGAENVAERREAISRVAELLQSNYVYPQQGRELAARLRRESKHAWVDAGEPGQFAQALTEKLRSWSGDGHFHIDFREGGATTTEESAFGAAEFEKYYGKGVNHGFEQVRRLEGDVGYLDLRVFAPPAMGADMAVAAMTLLAQSSALIIDLRHNGGGDGALGLLIAGYLLDVAQPMSGTYDRPSDKYTPSSTPVWVPGRRFGGGKPVFVLISKRTFSAAEAFAYDLQALKRVTVVGEPSGGGAHPFVYRRISDHYVLSLPEGRSINPITGKDWAGTGVIPDVRVNADQALEEALKLARAR
jgi:hypothetical protein